MSILKKNYDNAVVKLIEKIIRNPENVIEPQSSLSDKDFNNNDVYGFVVKSKDGKEIIKITYTVNHSINMPDHRYHSIKIDGKYVSLDNKKIQKLYHLADKEHTLREGNSIRKPKEKNAIMAFLKNFVRD